jgi:hypothetical protein
MKPEEAKDRLPKDNAVRIIAGKEDDEQPGKS